MDAPERIWAWTGRDNARRWHSAPTSRDCTEYIRADLALDAALVAELVEALREAGRTFGGLAQYLLDNKDAPERIVWPGVFADLQRAGIAARKAVHKAETTK